MATYLNRLEIAILGVTAVHVIVESLVKSSLRGNVGTLVAYCTLVLALWVVSHDDAIRRRTPSTTALLKATSALQLHADHIKFFNYT